MRISSLRSSSVQFRPPEPPPQQPARARLGIADGFTASRARGADPGAAALLGLKPGDTRLTLSDTRIEQLQRDLMKLGYLPPDFDTAPGFAERFGPRTTDALKRLQRDCGIPATGVVDAATVAYLSGQPLPLPDAVPDAGALQGMQKGLTNDPRIAVLQDALVERGYLPANFSQNSGYGKRFGDLTEAAVMRLQRDYGIVPTGHVDAATAAALGGGLAPAPVFRGTWPAYSQLGPAQGPMQELPDGTFTQRFAGGAMALSPQGEISVTDSMGRVLATREVGTASSVAEANQSFVNQEGNTAFYTSFNSSRTPYGYNDCGPTAALMALTELGLTPHPSAAEAPYAVDAVRDAIFGSTNWSRTMGIDSVAAGLQAYGARTGRLDVHLARADGTGLEAVDTALAAGHPVILGGTPGNAWAKGLNQTGGYLDMGRSGDASFGHFVTVMGRTPDGHYLVGDPLSKNGAIEVTAQQLGTFLTQTGWGTALEVMPP